MSTGLAPSDTLRDRTSIHRTRSESSPPSPGRDHAAAMMPAKVVAEVCRPPGDERQRLLGPRARDDLEGLETHVELLVGRAYLGSHVVGRNGAANVPGSRMERQPA